MRTYASDTALPGGKYEEGDQDEEGTAVSSCLKGKSHAASNSYSGERLSRRWAQNSP